jgi:Sulfotransferase family
MPNLRNLHKLIDPEIRAKNVQALRWNLTRPAVPDPVFVVGCSRSGTTVTYETLAASAAFLSFGWEIPQFWNSLHGPLNNGWHSEAAGREQARPGHREAAMRYFYERLGTGWVLDKTCINVMRIPYLLALFPKAKFVFIQRDGRDNISSMMDGWRMGRTDGRFELTQFFGPFPDPVAINGMGLLPRARLAGLQPRQPGGGVRVPVGQCQPHGARRGAPGAGHAVDPTALRGHLRAPGGDVPAGLRAPGRAIHARAACALRQPAAHQCGEGPAAATPKRSVACCRRSRR